MSHERNLRSTLYWTLSQLDIIRSTTAIVNKKDILTKDSSYLSTEHLSLWYKLKMMGTVVEGSAKIFMDN